MSKAIDKAAGAEREVVGTERSPFRMEHNKIGNVYESTQSGDTRTVDADGYIVRETTAPATPEAVRWQGWGTALKPGWEIIVVARKPLISTVAANILQYGTGALNIDACRLSALTPKEVARSGKSTNGSVYGEYDAVDWKSEGKPHAGRWPANVVLDEDSAAELDQQSGVGISRKGTPRGSENPGNGWRMTETGAEYDDTGGASRFFFVARKDDECEIPSSASGAVSSSSPPKPSADSVPNGAATSASRDMPKRSQERPTSATPNGSRLNDADGTLPTPNTEPRFSPELPPTKPSPTSSLASAAETPTPTGTTTTTPSRSTSAGSAEPATSSTTSRSKAPGGADLRAGSLGSRFIYTAKASTDERIYHNGVSHATVKPLSLMRWLVRLVTQPGGIVLEPFAGSGTTVEACILEGFRCIAVEREADYLPLITQRINRRRDPVAYLEASGDDLGLFGEIA